MRIAIDPGHGGIDPGAVGFNLLEKHVVLDVAKQLELLLADQHEVFLTRRDDVNSWSELGLWDRCRDANAFGADVFVSVHCNAFTTPSAHGSETFYFRGSYWGKRLARSLQKQLNQYCPEIVERRVDSAGFYVLRNTDAPAALVELGFLSNPQDSHHLGQEGYQKRAAQAIARGILDWWET